jgi:hypothetical protein
MPIPEHLKNRAAARPFQGQQPQRQQPAGQGQRPAPGGGGQRQAPQAGGRQQPARSFQQPAPRTQQAPQQTQGETRVENPFRGNGLTNATKNRKGQFFPPGMHRARIVDIKCIDSYQKPGVLFYIVEFVVLASDVPHVLPGQRRSWVVDLSKKPAWGDVREFNSIMFDMPFDDVGNDEANYSCSVEQPLRGFVLDIVCTATVSRKNTANPGTFTKHEFSIVCGPGGEGDDPNVVADPSSQGYDPNTSDDGAPPLDDADIPF